MTFQGRFEEKLPAENEQSDVDNEIRDIQEKEANTGKNVQF
jgi:hypothetical protein